MKLTARHSLQAFLIASTVLVAASASAASFVYRGSLNDRGEPAEGQYGFRLTFYDAQLGGKALSPPITLDGVSVSRGAFNATLDLDPKLEQRDMLWLAVEVRDAAGGFVALDRREAVQPKAAAAGTCWDTTGNSGNVDGTNFLGNVDNVPLDLRAHNVRLLRLEPSEGDTVYGDTANVIEGFPGNTVGSAIGATIGGGGASKDATSPCPSCYNSASGNFSVVSGGLANHAMGEFDTVAGGVRNAATSVSATVGGGRDNYAFAYGTVPGGELNCAGGDFSFAAGYRAVVRAPSGETICSGRPTSPDLAGDAGTFVYSDISDEQDFVSTGKNQFLVRAQGGVGIGTNAPTSQFHVRTNSNQLMRVETVTNGINPVIEINDDSPGQTRIAGINFLRGGAFRGQIAYDSNDVMSFSTFGYSRLSIDYNGGVAIGVGSVTPTDLIDTSANGAFLSKAGVWTDASSRWFKQDFAEIDTSDILVKVLALPLSTWRYRNALEHRHLGPMAEDFADAFGLGDDAQHLAPLDADGVALAAIQGLNHKLEDDKARLERANGELRAELQQLAARLEKLERDPR